MSDELKYPIFDLSPEDFEKLCLDLLNTTGIYRDLGLHNRDDNYLFADIYGKIENKHGELVGVAIEVKHWLKMNISKFKNEVLQRIDRLKDFTNIKFITSAKIENYQKDQINDIISPYKGWGLEIIDQSDLFKLLDLNPKIAEKYFKPVRKHNTLRTIQFSVSIMGAIGSILSVLIFGTLNIITPKEEVQTLDNKIQIVEQAITNINDLEGYLNKIKKDMRETKIDIDRIKREYEEVQELKKLTDEELAILNKALQKKSFIDVVLNYFFGFVLGVTASVIGGIIIERRRKLKRLT